MLISQSTYWRNSSWRVSFLCLSDDPDLQESFTDAPKSTTEKVCSGRESGDLEKRYDYIFRWLLGPYMHKAEKENLLSLRSREILTSGGNRRQK